MTRFLVTLFRANKHWVIKESNLDRYTYTIDLWLRTVGFGITKEHLGITFSGIILYLISIVPFTISEILAIPYHYYYLSRVLGESSNTLGIDTALIFLTCFLSFIKPLWLLFKRCEIYHVVTHAQELGPIAMPRSSWILTTAYAVTIYINCISRMLIPLRKRELPEKNMMIPGLENTLESPDFEIMSMLYSVGLVTFIPNLVCFYALYIGLAGHITAHYNKLCAEFENLLQDVTIEESCDVNYEELKKRLIQLIEQHCKVIEVTLNVRTLFNSTFGFDFGMVTLGMAVLLIQLSRVGVTPCLDFIAYYIITLTVYCIPGDNMRAAADQLPINIMNTCLENTLESPDFEIMSMLYSVGLVTFIPNLVCFYALYIGLAGHITAHYNKLCAEFENLLQDVTIEESCDVNYEELKKRLIQLIEQHCKVIEVTLNVRTLFNSTFGFDFGMVTLGMAVLLIQLSRVGVTPCLDFIAYYIITLTVYCIPGDNMRAAADQLPTSVWSSGWEVFKPRERRSVLMVLRSAQKQQILTAATFVPVTYQTLMKIVKTCFSIYAAFDAAKGEIVTFEE